MKKIAAFTLTYFIITMAWAYPWHMIWFHDLYAAMGAFTRPAPIMGLGMAAIVIQGIVFAYLYSAWLRGPSTIAKGIGFNLTAGLLVYTAMGFATAAKIQIEPVGTFLIYHTVFQSIQFALSGAALGLIYAWRPDPVRRAV